MNDTSIEIGDTMSIQTDDEETIYQAYSAGEMVSEIIRLRAVFVAETQRRQAAEAVVNAVAEDAIADANLLGVEYRAKYPKEPV